MIKILIVSNNPLLKGDDDVLFVEGHYHDVLIKVRDMVYNGYELISHPLFASSRMMFSPFRTIILGNKNDRPSLDDCQVIENSIIKFETLTAHRNAQPEHDNDYAELDLSLHEAALEEIEILANSHVI